MKGQSSKTYHCYASTFMNCLNFIRMKQENSHTPFKPHVLIVLHIDYVRQMQALTTSETGSHMSINKSTNFQTENTKTWNISIHHQYSQCQHLPCPTMDKGRKSLYLSNSTVPPQTFFKLTLFICKFNSHIFYCCKQFTSRTKCKQKWHSPIPQSPNQNRLLLVPCILFFNINFPHVYPCLS